MRRALSFSARILAKAILWFAGISLTLVIAFKWMPIPVTATMLMDERSVTRDWEPLSRIDRNMVSAAIAAEDSRFCEHNGFDVEAIENALAERARGERQRGASTISQQTAKNVFLWQGGGWFRKGLETYFTFLIENLWTKRRIMEVYLNVAETGQGTYGVAAGSERHPGHARTGGATVACVPHILHSHSSIRVFLLPESRRERNILLGETFARAKLNDSGVE